ncbi:hypothetical protein E4U41_004787 [Claviceps citrina]|nr:hypothetical protein E4U41_004787 [Claviceps citrina]
MNRRQNIRTELSTCGYQDGDAKKSRTANSGYNCRVETAHGIWGFCPTTVIAATDCGLAGGCLDNYSCSSTYTNYACAGSPKTDHYLAVPTARQDDTRPTSQVAAAKSLTNSAASSHPSEDGKSDRPDDTNPTSQHAVPATTSSTNTAAGGPPSGDGGSDAAAPNNNIGPIVGGVLGGIALLCASGLAAIHLLSRSRSGRSGRSKSPPVPLGPASGDGDSGGENTRGRSELPDFQHEKRVEGRVELES